MPALLDLRCEGEPSHLICDEIVRDCIYPTCPACGAPTHATWERGQAPGMRVFRPMQVGTNRVIDDESEWNRTMAQIKERYPDHEIVVSPESQAERNQRADEARQRVYDRRKERGIDEYTIAKQAEMRAVAERQSLREAERTNSSPEAARSTALAAVPSAAVLANPDPGPPLLAGKATIVEAKPGGTMIEATAE